MCDIFSNYYESYVDKEPDKEEKNKQLVWSLDNGGLKESVLQSCRFSGTSRFKKWPDFVFENDFKFLVYPRHVSISQSCIPFM